MPVVGVCWTITKSLRAVRVGAVSLPTIVIKDKAWHPPHPVAQQHIRVFLIHLARPVPRPPLGTTQGMVTLKGCAWSCRSISHSGASESHTAVLYTSDSAAPECETSPAWSSQLPHNCSLVLTPHRLT